MYSSSLSDLKKTTKVVESLSKTSTRCFVPENINQLQDYINRMRNLHQTDGPAFNTRSQTQQHSKPDTPTMPPSITPDIASTLEPTPKSFTADKLEALLQMQKTDPFHKCISK